MGYHRFKPPKGLLRGFNSICIHGYPTLPTFIFKIYIITGPFVGGMPVPSNTPAPGQDRRGGHGSSTGGIEVREGQGGHVRRGVHGYRGTQKQSSTTLQINERSVFKCATKKMDSHVYQTFDK